MESCGDIRRMWGLHVICNYQNGEFKMSETDMDNLWCQNISHHFCAEIRVAQWVRSLDLTAHTIPSPIRRGFAPSFVNYKKGCTRLAAASDKVYQLLAQGRWFSPASSTNKTDCHDIAEILLKVTLKHQTSINQSK